MVAHKDSTLNMLRKSAILPPRFRKILEWKYRAVRTSFAAGRRCRPSAHGTTTLVILIIG